MENSTAIFPLNTVLFPGGVLPLRVFETRYVDMIRETLTQNRPFGVCLIQKGSEVGPTAEPESIGCLAQITDWDMQQAGVLNIRVTGLNRFRVKQTEAQSNGLLRAEIEPLDADKAAEIPDHCNRSVRLLKRIIDDLEASRKNGKLSSPFLPFEPPYLFEDAGWIANRLAELVPMALSERQSLLEMTDGAARLIRIDAFLSAHKIIR